MGHAITFEVVKNRKDIMKVAENFAFYNTDRGENYDGSYHGNMTIHDNIICDNIEQAKNKINQLDNGWYDDHAVQFYDIPKIKPTKQMLNILAKIDENKIKKNEYEEKHKIQNLKSKLITCPNCGSRIAKDYTESQKCPVCKKQDLRANYIIERLNKFDEDNNKLLKQYKKIEQERKDKQSEKFKGKAPIKWLVKIEVHC